MAAGRDDGRRRRKSACLCSQQSSQAPAPISYWSMTRSRGGSAGRGLAGSVLRKGACAGAADGRPRPTADVSENGSSVVSRRRRLPNKQLPPESHVTARQLVHAPQWHSDDPPSSFPTSSHSFVPSDGSKKVSLGRVPLYSSLSSSTGFITMTRHTSSSARTRRTKDCGSHERLSTGSTLPVEVLHATYAGGGCP